MTDNIVVDSGLQAWLAPRETVMAILAGLEQPTERQWVVPSEVYYGQLVDTAAPDTDCEWSAAAGGAVPYPEIKARLVYGRTLFGFGFSSELYLLGLVDVKDVWTLFEGADVDIAFDGNGPMAI